MTTRWSFLAVGLVASVLLSGPASPAGPAEEKISSWQQALNQAVPLMGHRNWIVVVDSAYPLQTREGIKTVATGSSQTTVVQAVLDAVSRAPHVRPIVFLDKELDYVPEQDAPGIGAYRRELRKILGETAVKQRLHEEIINELDQAARTFSVLVLKTTMTLPYTSVFVRLNCGYWSDAAESRLRERMKTGRAATVPGGKK